MAVRAARVEYTFLSHEGGKSQRCFRLTLLWIQNIYLNIRQSLLQDKCINIKVPLL